MSRNPYYTGNPYARGFYPVPGYQPPMKTPEQYQADLLKQLQPNFDAYNNQYKQYQDQQNLINNSGHYVKVGSYEEVKNVQAPSDGRPVIIIDENNGFLYSKKFENGNEYIKAFRLVPNEVIEEQKKTETKNVESKENDPLDIILERLNSMDERLQTLEGAKQHVDD